MRPPPAREARLLPPPGFWPLFARTLHAMLAGSAAEPRVQVTVRNDWVTSVSALAGS